MAADSLKPIYSSRASDPAIGEALDRFVVGLGECIDRLQDAELEGDLEQLATLARALSDEAEATGYGTLAAVAQTLESACLDRDGKLAREATFDLTEITQRIRLGHKGSV